MNRNLFVIILAFIGFILCCPLPALPQNPTVVCLQSMRIRPYDEALTGFRSRCSADLKHIVVSEFEGIDISTKISDIKPSLIFAIGHEALCRANDIPDIPVVYAMTQKPDSICLRQNIYGISMQIPAEKQIELFSMTLPDIRRIGMICRPDRFTDFIADAGKAAATFNITLITEPISDAKKVPETLASMTSRIDALWLVPDMAVMTAEIMEYLMLYSMEHKIPLLSFSRKYIETGAVISISAAADQMGRQAAELAEKLISGGMDSAPPPVSGCRSGVLSVNLTVAGKLGVKVNGFIMNTPVAVRSGCPSVISTPFAF